MITVEYLEEYDGGIKVSEGDCFFIIYKPIFDKGFESFTRKFAKCFSEFQENVRAR